MSVPVINAAKELAQTYQPLLLVQLSWPDGFTLYLSTHNLNASTGGIQYQGNNYLPRIIDQNITATQALSEQGVSLAPTVTVKLADADAWLYANVEATRGFKGAKMTIPFVFWNVGSNDFSPDSLVKFVGQCGSPQIDDKTITVTAINKVNLAPLNIPAIKIQPYCPWIFPTTPALQQAAANGTNQQSKECPYNPSGTSNQLGNLNPSTNQPYTSCSNVLSDCQARGMYTRDNQNRKSGCFGGIQYNPPSSSTSRSYISGNWEQVFNVSPEAKYGDLIPLMYGTGWMVCKVLNESNDANYTSMEVLLTYGKIGSIFKVIVNGVEIPHVFGDPVCASTPADVTNTKDALRIGFWAGVNDGSINGQPDGEPQYGGKGDPYGSLAVLYITVVNSICQPGSIPNVQVLFQGQQIRQYSSLTSYTEAYSSNPAWIIMDMLTWLNFQYEELDIQSFIDASTYCSQLIPYTSQYGVSGQHARFDYTLALSTRQDGATAIRQALAGIRGILLPNYDNGLLRLVIKKTLADQQPNPVDGSNYNNPVASWDSSGNPKNGYVAYYFHEGTIAEDGHGNTTLKIVQRQLNDAPNQVGFNFQDSENTYSSDSIQITDAEDVARTGQVVPGAIQVQGPNTYDHCQRIIMNFFAENYRGNNRLAADGETIGDTGGTMSFQFETSFRVLKVHVGDIVMLDAAKYGLTQQLFRVRQIQPDVNFERTKIVVDFHNDAWYMDFFGQTGAPKWQSGWRSPSLAGVRPLIASAAPLLADTVDPVFANDTPNSLTEMGLAPVQYASQGGGSSALLIARIAPPANIFDNTLTPPFVPTQSLTANTGGALPGGYTYYVAFVALSANGCSRLSATTKVFIPAGTTTNTISVTNLYWDADTTGFRVYAGISPDRLYRQSGNYSTSGGTDAQPNTVTITGKLTQNGAPPDPMLSKIRFKAKPMFLPGIVTLSLTSATLSGGSWTLGLNIPQGNSGFATNALVGRQVSLLGRASMSEADIYPCYLTITANTSATITVNADVQNLIAFEAGDQITIRMKPTIGSDSTGNYIDDELLVNPVQAQGLQGLQFANWWPPVPFESANLQYLLLRIVSGTGEGTTVSIASATQTRMYIVGNWPVTPDATSIFVVESIAWWSTVDTGTIQNNGNLGVQSSVIDVSAWKGQPVLIQAVAVDTNGNESTDPAQPVREAYLLGAGGGGDSGTPPAPLYAANADGDGNIIISQVGIPQGETNFSTISAATVQFFCWPMSHTGPDYTLAANIDNATGTITTSQTLGTINTGTAAVIGQEIVIITAASGTTLTVLRGAQGSTSASHNAGDGIFLLTSSQGTMSFPPLFFEQRQSIDFFQGFALDGLLLVASEMYFTNMIGDGPPTQQCYTGTPGFPYQRVTLDGVHTPIGGIAAINIVGNAAFTLVIFGTLAIGSDQAMRVQRDIGTVATGVTATLKTAPSGAAVTITINAGGASWLTLTIPAGQTSISATSAQIAALSPIAAGANVTIDITSVGSSFPGADLTVQIYG